MIMTSKNPENKNLEMKEKLKRKNELKTTTTSTTLLRESIEKNENTLKKKNPPRPWKKPFPNFKFSFIEIPIPPPIFFSLEFWLLNFHHHHQKIPPRNETAHLFGETSG